MRIIPALHEDVTAVLSLERGIPEAPHWTEGEYRVIVAGGVDGISRCLLLAVMGEELVGFAAGKVLSDEGELESVAVKASARRQAIGRKLCLAVWAWAQERGARVFDLEVRAGSAGALAMYTQLGFRQVGLRRGYYADPVDDAVLMRLEEGAGR